MTIFSRRSFLSAIPAPFVMRRMDGSAFKVQEYIQPKYPPKERKCKILMEVNGKMIVGPSPIKATLIDKYPPNHSHPGMAGIDVESEEMYIRSTSDITDITAFKLVDPWGETISEKRMTVHVGHAMDHTLHINFSLGCAPEGATNALPWYSRKLIYRMLKEAGL